MKKHLWIFALLMIAVMIPGCASTDVPPNTPQDESIVIAGLVTGDATYTVEQLKALDAFSGHVEGADSAGDAVEFDVTGAYFTDVLEQNGSSQAELAGIRISATDGYSVEVSQDILAARDIILAYELNGEPLDADSAPIRVIIPDERAMYWVRMVAKIEVISVRTPEEVSGVYFMETLYSDADYEDYEYLGERYQTLNTKTILTSYPGNGGSVVLMTAADGLKKNETVENFYKGAITMTGENAPEFFSATLPEGMFVKELILFKYGGNAFYFAPSAMEYSQTLTLQVVADECGLIEAERYTLVLADGNTLTVEAEDLQKWQVACGDDVSLCNPESDETYEGLISISERG